MGTAEAAVRSLAAVEANQYAGQEPDPGWSSQGNCIEVGHERPWPMVERRGCTYAQGHWEVILREIGSGVAYDPTSPASSCFMNRRVRNRMHGGVGGRRG